MSDINEKIKDILSRVHISANGQVDTDSWGYASINLSAPDGMDYWEWIEQASNDALSEADTLTAKVAELEAALEELSTMISNNYQGFGDSDLNAAFDLVNKALEDKS